MLLKNVMFPGAEAPVDLAVTAGEFTQPSPLSSTETPVDASGWVALPAMIDLHVHGGGGHDMSASPESLCEALAFHHRHGVKATLVSLVTAAIPDLCRQLSWVAEAVEEGVPEGRVLGAHLEGPFLSQVRCGAQNPRFLQLPDPRTFDLLLTASRGTLRMVTVAPELPGALDLIDQAVAAGVVVAVGHTDATYDQTIAAIDRGATAATHLFNGMRPAHHREPGPALAALERGLVCELINDGEHLHPATARLARDRARPALITDAIAAAGMDDGDYRLGGQDVVVAWGRATLAASDGSPGSLAGSTLTLDRAASRALRDGWSPEQVARATSSTPATLLGIDELAGTIAPGHAAEAVLFSMTDGAVQGYLRAGHWQPT